MIESCKLPFIIFIVLIGAWMFVSPRVTLAQACYCYCESSAGAVYEGQLTNITACQATCDDYLGCFKETSDPQAPDNNSQCYSQYECENDTTEIDGEEIASEWGGQASTCPKGEGQCYSAGNAVNLAVSILDPSNPGSLITQIDSVPDYINALYNFLIPAASLLAVVMLMIAGLQWMLARGDAGRIGKAKDKMRNAVVGLVLLMSAVTIAQFVDPSYVNLAHIQPPKVRTVTFLDPDSSCEILEFEGFIITAIGKECGNEGVVEALGGEESTWQVGDTCIYHTCTDTKEQCIRSTQAEGGYACASCAQWDSAGISPSAGNCKNLQNIGTGDEDKENIYYCEYWETDYLDLSTDQCVELVYPGGNVSVNDYIDCDILGADYEYSCRGYDEVWSFALSLDAELLNELDDIDGANNDYPLLQTVCSEDPCGFAPSGEKCEVWIPSQMEGAVNTCETGLGSLIPFCEDIVTELERTDCINSGFVDAFQKKLDAASGEGDVGDVEDPVCKNRDGEEIDCFESI